MGRKSVTFDDDIEDAIQIYRKNFDPRVIPSFTKAVNDLLRQTLKGTAVKSRGG